jgi:hypothetical protein
VSQVGPAYIVEYKHIGIVCNDYGVSPPKGNMRKCHTASVPIKDSRKVVLEHDMSTDFHAIVDNETSTVTNSSQDVIPSRETRMYNNFNVGGSLNSPTPTPVFRKIIPKSNTRIDGTYDSLKPIKVIRRMQI